MSAPAAAPAPAPAPAAPKKFRPIRSLFIGFLGLCSGAAATYATAIFDRIVKPLPVANFAIAADGLTITCQNHATGDNGWWDFGDGSPLEPFDSEQTQVTHSYASPGSYSVKLVVRNVLGKENDRSVNVDAKPSAKDEPPPPKIAAFAVQPLSAANMAPATFRVTADVTNAEHVVWDLGDGRVEVTDTAGKIDRMVTFEKPGQFPIQLVAHNGKTAAKQGSAVEVKSPPDGTLMAVVTITDGGTEVAKNTHLETMAVPAPRDSTAAFSRNLWAKPGCTLTEVVLAKPDVPGVKNLKLAISADKRSAAISGEFINVTPGKVGADALIPLKVTEERASSRAPRAVQASAVLQMATPTKGTATVPLPQMHPNAEAVSRKIDVEVRQIGPGGKTYVVAAGPLVGRTATIAAKNVYSPPAAARTTASYDIATVKIDFEIVNTVTPAGGTGR
jgi:hypothetical protein